MDVKQINGALNKVFHEENARIVFWNDPDHEFGTALPNLNLDDVNNLKLDEIGSLEAKIRLERNDPEGRYLLYAPWEEPDFEEAPSPSETPEPVEDVHIEGPPSPAEVREAFLAPPTETQEPAKEASHD